ncbi:hypothetical protein F4813DRAFT_360453 [Daldinia decipiens]|uniref:uncharacterized protein n=1 Tax=Daldinia decipiens TaxID=326647 RepID=UPI0020C3DB07|nr:uncharacterized protein F4813DRAFT_360453 [Daldinia decipiens]KAI1657561.1 hypothetical protein F4813DRAFT_360453 [Daldinia decipiens]
MDVADSSNPSKVGKLLPKKLATKRWKKQPSKESFGSTASSEDYSRGRSTSSLGLKNGSFSTTQVNEMADDDEDGREEPEESPEAYCSDPEDVSAARPTVPSTHPSQIGQLTTSSPLIQADHLPEIQNQSTDDLTNTSRSATFAVTPIPSFSYEPARQLSHTKTSLQPPQTPSSRSKSPTSRFRDAFRGKRNVSGAQEVGSDSQTDVADNEEVKTSSRRSTAGSTSRPGSSTASQSDTSDKKIASSAREGRSKKPPSIDTSGRPLTPPSIEPAAPVIVNTPPTPTESHRSRKNSAASASSVPNVVVQPAGSMISSRRRRSGSGTSIGPSKLSNITLAPLTPTPENPPLTPGGGFFSSMLSAAQTAANTLSTAVTNTNLGSGGNKAKSNVPRETQPGDDDRVEVETSAGQLENTNMGDKEPAVKTLGMGDLSLSQLGIQEPGSIAPTPTTTKFSDSTTESRTRSESAPVDNATASANGDGHSDDLAVGGPRSVYEPSATSPPTSLYEGKSGLQRSGSTKSALARTRRKRGSTGGTAGTGTTIGAAIAAANASVAHPSAAGSTPKLTGFAVASKKRNRDFHVLFKSVPDDDYLIEDYSCALQREILAHGRLYVSESHLCFSSNIFGWVTTLVISFDEIVSVEKRSTALVFRNGLMISTLHAKHVFASFTSRDSTYDLIVNIWKLGHPTLQSSLNGVSLEGTGGDKTEKVEDADAAVGSRSGTGSEEEESEDGEDVYDEDQDDDALEVAKTTDASPADTDGEKSGGRKVSGAVIGNGAVEKTDFAPTPSGTPDFPGPATHAPTDCGDTDAHYEVVVGDDIIPAPLGKVYTLIFGPASPVWMGKWLTGEQKCTDLQMEDKKGLTQDNKSRGFTYIKPLYASIGPKQTKCLVTETLENLDLEKSVNVLVVVQNPDVPSGNVFSVKTKYCLSWAENNSTHVNINCTIEWTGKSWLKGPIEKGAKDGQTQYCKDLFAALKGAVSTAPRPVAVNGGAVKGKKKRVKGKLHQASKESLSGPSDLVVTKSQDWGVFEPLHGILGPVLDILGPVLTGNVVYGLLVGLLVATWFGFGFNGQPRGAPYGRDLGFIGYPDRVVAYDEIWRREESDLWDWLEDRVGLHRMNEGAMPVRKRVMEPRTVEEKLREERMNEREVEEAIKVTEEKLQVLKSVMDRKKTPPKSSVYGRPTTKVPATER